MSGFKGDSLSELLRNLGFGPATTGVECFVPDGPPRCPDCGFSGSCLDMEVGIIRVTHPAPVCAVFARAMEEQP